MIKSKFGTRVRAKTPTAQVNEVLAKVLCHNVEAVAGGYHAKGPGAGREIVGYGRTKEEAEHALQIGQERSFRLETEARKRSAIRENA